MSTTRRNEKEQMPNHTQERKENEEYQSNRKQERRKRGNKEHDK